MKALDKTGEIARSLLKGYRSKIWSKFTKAIVEYKLIKENDKIAVCISGGKDSMILAKCMQILHEHSEVPFDIVYLVMNPGYNKENVELIKKNASIFGFPIEMFETNIFDIVDAQEDKGSPCYLCARMRRGALYRKAHELGCNKIALGHHFDDVVETTMLSLLYGGKIQSMMPKLHSDNYEGMELIRPFYYVKEKDIISFSKKNELTFLRCACHFTAEKQDDSKRKEVKELIEELTKKNKGIEMNIFKAMYNVNVDTAIAYQKDTVTYHFLDNYDKKVNHAGKEQFNRNEMLYDNEKLANNIYTKKVAIFGVGGVGGYVCEALARCGINGFYLYDNDEVDISNINRQIIATFKTIGQDKVSAMEDRILSINPSAKVNTYKMFVDENTMKDINFEEFDYIVDAIDSVDSKIALIKKAKEYNIPIISSMGAGNRFDIHAFKVMDINQTSNDPLARAVRTKLRKEGIDHVKVVCSTEVPVKVDKAYPGSNPFTPSTAGLTIANEVFNDLLNNEVK